MLHHLENHIENIRQKPHHTKKQYAFGVSLAFTLILFLIWIIGFKPTNTLTSDYKQPVKPVKALTASAGDAFDYIKSYFTFGNKTNYQAPASNVEVLPGKI